MASYKPDVISLNEVDTSTLATTMANLMKAKTGVTWEWYYDNRGNQVLTRLPQTAESICVVNAGVGRKATHIGVVRNGRNINVWSAHLDVSSSSVRVAETTALRTCEKGWTEARIAAGDFNMQPFTSEYYSMATDHTDAWLAAPSRLNYPGNCDGCTRNSRIDYVFTSKGASWLVLKSAQIFDTRNSNGVMASDHKPMLVTYDVK
jgi:endonuclease/exonuclease/phosphatase family metal-dependent hydrolase